MTVDRSTLSPQKILEKYILPRVAFEPNTGCWIWLGHLHPAGYGTARLPHANKPGWSTQGVARVVYEIVAVPLSAGRRVQNQCKLRCCVNPDHHSSISQNDWLHKRSTWKRAADRTTCHRGHAFSEENTLRKLNGRKACRICKSVNEQKHKEKRRGEDWRKFGEFLESTELSDKRQLGPTKYYVYHLIDPFTQKVFYVGKGCGGRVFHHERDLLAGVYGNSKKEAAIRAIWTRGGEVQFSIIERHLTEARALWLEQAEIHRIGIDNLTNRASASIPHQFRRMM
jgi:hypothetical protein